ncbi:hypothetical protein Tco_0684018, partial [Tanacetum coccineum]
VIVPVSNLIEALAVVKNGVPRMKGLGKPFVGEFRIDGVGHDVHVRTLIDEGINTFNGFLGCKVNHATGWQPDASTTSSFLDVSLTLALLSTSFTSLVSTTSISVSVLVGSLAQSDVDFVLLLSLSSPFVKEIEFKFFVTGNLAFH